MFKEMVVRVVIQLDEELDNDLTAYVAAQWGSVTQGAINQAAEAALTQLLEEGGEIQVCGSPAEEDWELETPTGCFHIRGGRVEPGSVPAATIAQILATIYKEVHHANNSRGHREEKGGETKAQ